jgi:hypothetical protein
MHDRTSTELGIDHSVRGVEQHACALAISVFALNVRGTPNSVCAARKDDRTPQIPMAGIRNIADPNAENDRD